MPVPRKFDYDEAARLRAEGLTYQAIAERFGVTAMAVYWAVNEEARERAIARNTEWQRSGTCPDCGGPSTRHSITKSLRCKACFDRTQATSVHEDELRCFRCREWKPDEAFPRNRSGRKLRRGRHNFCRACSTVVRQEYRERHKVPCVGCGAPALPPREKGSDGADVPRCRSCYDASRQKVAA